MMDVEKEIWQCPLIMENVLKFFCAKDLSSCAKVCSLWHELSANENRRRRFVEWFLEDGIGQSIDMDGNMVASPPSGTVYPFQKKLATIRARPNLCLAFVTTETLKHFDKVFPCFESSFPIKKKLKKNYKDLYVSRLKEVGDRFLNPLLPVECQLHCIASPGIIGCHDNCSPSEVEDGPAISGLLLPNFPGVSVHHYKVERDGQCEVFQCDIQNTPIKCLLIFKSTRNLLHIQNFITRCVKHNSSSDFAMGGALVDALASGVDSCFTFAGENVEAASVVIDKNVMDVAKELSLFKKTGLLENRCFAFMFSCVGKGIYKYRVPNYESSIFKSMYPNVPLTGVFGNGEIGMHYLPNVDKVDTDNELRSKKFPHVRSVHHYCSVFVLVSVKEPVVSKEPPVKK